MIGNDIDSTLMPFAPFLSTQKSADKRGQKPRLYVSFPLALAAAIGLEPGDEVQWELLDRGELHLLRAKTVPVAAKSTSRKS
jgi:hypothetical protein